MKPAKVQATCPECSHEFEARGQCVRHLPVPKEQRAKKSVHRASFKKEDLEWAEAVKQRDGYTCRKCGRGKPQVQLHAAHILSRRYKATRHSLEAGLTLCAGCHLFWAHREPIAFAEWVKSEIGEEAYEDLRKRAHRLVKRVKKGAA